MASIPQVAVIDFETEAIAQRPFYPPRPVGVSVKLPGRQVQYFAWGHPTENNCTEKEAAAALKFAVKNYEVLFHNAKFDIDVMETFFGIKPPAAERIHDTMLLLFLHDPHAPSFALKPCAERLLNMPPTERDDVFRWLVEHKVVTASATKGWGAHIAKAPGRLVGAYANGDVDRTEKLFRYLYPKVRKAKMLEAYQREQRLMPVLLETERRGIAVNHEKLRADVKLYASVQAKLDRWVYKRVGAGPFKIDSGPVLVDTLSERDLLDLRLLGKTPKGEWKTDKESLAAAITDPTLAAVLNYRASLATCMSTFMGPWLAMADASGGFIYTQWNQIKGFGDKAAGAVTGRLSSSPNFQNVPKVFAKLFKDEFDPKNPKEAKAYKSAPKRPMDLPPLPLMRSYIVPRPGHMLLDRDYSQQELRILAHFEQGELLEQYSADVWMDVHDRVRGEVNSMLGTSFERGIIKTVNFGLIYGMGVGLLAQRSGSTVQEARAVKNAVLKRYPGLKELYRDMRERAAANTPLRTWGGRVYHCEPPKLINGEMRTFDYKMVNVLVQGSAADCTKQALLNYSESRRHGHVLLTVHDEVLVEVPIEHAASEMVLLQECMESVEFDIPILSEGKVSSTNWAELKPYDKKGDLL